MSAALRQRHQNESKSSNDQEIDDIFSYMCSLAVAKCAKKSEKKKASCGGAAMRKRLLIKNFVTQMLDQERQMSQTGREQLSREVCLPSRRLHQSKSSTNSVTVKQTRLYQHRKVVVVEEEEEEEEEQEEEEEEEQEEETEDEGVVDEDCFVAEEGEEDHPMEESNQVSDEDDEQPNDNGNESDESEDEADHNTLDEGDHTLVELNNNTKPSKNNTHSLLPHISLLDRPFPTNPYLSESSSLCDDEESLGVGEVVVVVEDELSADDKQAPPSWHDVEPDLFMLERSAPWPGEVEEHEDYSVVTTSSDSTSSYELYRHDYHLISSSSGVDATPPPLPENFMDEAPLTQQNTYAELRSSPSTTNKTLYSSTADAELELVVGGVAGGEKDKVVGDEEEPQAIVSSAFVDLINMANPPSRVRDCRVEALQPTRHITDLDTQLTSLIEEEDEDVYSDENPHLRSSHLLLMGGDTKLPAAFDDYDATSPSLSDYLLTSNESGFGLLSQPLGRVSRKRSATDFTLFNNKLSSPKRIKL